MLDKVKIYSDGGSRNNPGPSAIGAVIIFSDKSKVELQKYIGIATNNVAEYKAIFEALKNVKKGLENAKVKQTIIDCYLDSELVVKQLNREYKVKNADLLKIYLKIEEIIRGFKKVNFNHIKREKNKEADRLVNIALDKRIHIRKK